MGRSRLCFLCILLFKTVPKLKLTMTRFEPESPVPWLEKWQLLPTVPQPRPMETFSNLILQKIEAKGRSFFKENNCHFAWSQLIYCHARLEPVSFGATATFYFLATSFFSFGGRYNLESIFKRDFRNNEHWLFKNHDLR